MDEIAAEAGLEPRVVGEALDGLATDGLAFGVRYQGDVVKHWRATTPPPFGGTGHAGEGDGAIARVRAALRAMERGMTPRQIAAAAGVDVRSVRVALEHLFTENHVIRIHHTGDGAVYWRVPGSLSRPTP